MSSEMRELVKEMREALEGVVRVADRNTVEFDRARAAIAKAAPAVFANTGDSEAQFIADGESLNCPSCGGSGHVEDALLARTEAGADGAAMAALQRESDKSMGVGFDQWFANPYTAVLLKSIAEDYVPRPHPQDASGDAEKDAEIARLNAIINSPQSDDFLRAVSTEAEHQRQRWGSDHDAGKAPADWFWLVGYLGGKALHSHAAGDTTKAEHHIITTAAACANWHRAMFGRTDMRPGIDGQAAMQAKEAK